MFRKIFAAMLIIACAFAMMPVKSSHAAADRRAAFEPQANVVIGTQARAGRISYSIQFDIGFDATLIEISPAGANVWTPFLNQDQANAMVVNRNIGYFSQVVYNTNVYDFRVNGVVWNNIELKNDRLIILGYDYEPVVVFVQDSYRQ
jgi:hypothetical protein